VGGLSALDRAAVAHAAVIQNASSPGATTQAAGGRSGATDGQNSQPGLVNRTDQGPDSHVPRTYTLGIGDIIRINVFEEPQFNGAVVVRPDGKISLPLISEVYVAGLTPAATEQLLTLKLAKYVNHPRVTVTVQEIHSRLVYVTGEVLRPGAYALPDTIDVVQLIARAGGVTAYAKKKQVYVLHAGSGLRTKVDYRKVLLGQHVEQNVQLNPGDTVVVP
jgi:polysaccharide export outer membrane protein